MASYFVRIFSIVPRTNLIDVQNTLMQSGLTVEPAGTNRFFIKDGTNEPLLVELTDTSSDVTRDDILQLTEMVQKSRTSSAEARIFVLNNLVRTVSLIAIQVADGADMVMMEWLIEQLLEPEDLVHVEDEGFYLDGELIVPL